MSGKKRSDIQLEQDRKIKLDLIANIKQTRGKIIGLDTKISEILDKAPPGIKTTFARETRAANDWKQTVKDTKIKTPDMGAAESSLRNTLSVVNGLSGNGEDTLNKLTNAYYQQASALEKDINHKLAVLEANYYGLKDLIIDWEGPSAISRFENSFTQSRRLLASKQLKDADKQVNEIASNLDLTTQEVSALQDKHEKRLYVLESLRKTCEEMGWLELGEPVLENNDKRGRFKYEVDTRLSANRDNRKITFYLSLEEISSQSGIVKNECISRFDKLSEKLRAQFGIKTKFEIEGGVPDGHLKQQGEMDMPGDADKQMYA